MTRGSMLGGFVLFSNNFTYVRRIAAIASAGHSCPALATEPFIPSQIGVVFADPPDAKTNGGHLLSITRQARPRSAAVGGGFQSQGRAHQAFTLAT
jgi:hypothetical protein